MFQRILAPVDLEHLDRLERALKVTAEEARHHGAPVVFVSVSAAAPGPLAHNPDEFRAILRDRIDNHELYREFWIATDVAA